MFIVDAFEPIIEQTKTGATNFFPLWFFGGLTFFAVVFIIIISIKEGSLKAGIVMTTFVTIVLGVFGVSAFQIVNRPVTESEYNIKDTKIWVEQTYLIEMNDKQAEKLIEGRINIDGRSINSSPVLATYYGKNVLIQLVKTDDGWALFKNDEELPRATK